MIGNTEDLCAYIARGPWEKEKVVYLPNFVDEANPTHDKNQLKEKYNIPVDKKIILLAGRLHEDKGFDVIIPLLNHIPEEYHIVLAGEGDYRPDLEKLVLTHTLQNRVHFLGWIDYISEIYSLTDIFVVPSQHETLGNVVLDGWAHRLPVISSRTEGPKVLIQDHENGLLVDIDDAEGFRTAILEVIRNPELGKKLAQAGNTKLKEQFSKEAVIQQYIHFYRSIL